MAQTAAGTEGLWWARALWNRAMMTIFRAFYEILHMPANNSSSFPRLVPASRSSRALRTVASSHTIPLYEANMLAGLPTEEAWLKSKAQEHTALVHSPKSLYPAL